MIGQSGYLTAAIRLPSWSVQFAREPEPDLDLDEIPEEPNDRKRAVTVSKSSVPKGIPPRRSSGKRLLLLVLLLIIGGVAYLSMDPGMLMEMLGQGSENAMPPPPSPTRVTRPQPPATSSPSSPMASSPAQPPAGVVTVPPPASVPAVPTQPMSAPHDPSVATAQPAPLPAAAAPLFREGQHVFVIADPTQPNGVVLLSADPMGFRSGVGVSPNTPLTVMDGELRNNVWIYAVRTEQGLMGWVNEKRLMAKP